MRRREFITLFDGAAAGWTLAARAQQPGRIYRIGSLQQAPRDAPHHVCVLHEVDGSRLYRRSKIFFATYRLPAIYQSPEIAEQGGLLGYGPRIVQVYRDIFARQAADILRGSKPGEIPVEQPTPN